MCCCPANWACVAFNDAAAISSAFSGCAISGLRIFCPFHVSLSPPPHFAFRPFVFLCVFLCLVFDLSAVFTFASQSLVLADAVAVTVFTVTPHSLVLADAAAPTFLTPAPPSLVLADAAAAAVFTAAPPSLVLAQVPDALLGCSRIGRSSRGLVRCGRCAVSSPHFFAALSAWAPSVCALIRHPLRAALLLFVTVTFF